jgi:hypothetical protein
VALSQGPCAVQKVEAIAALRLKVAVTTGEAIELKIGNNLLQLAAYSQCRDGDLSEIRLSCKLGHNLVDGNWSYAARLTLPTNMFQRDRLCKYA